MASKKCNRCGQVYTGELSEFFYTKKNGKLKTPCKRCYRKRSSKRYANNRDDISEYGRRRYEKFREERIAAQKEYQAEIIYTMKLDGYGDRDVSRGTCKNWNCKANQGYQLGVPGDHISAAIEWEYMWNRQGGLCALSGKPMVPFGHSSDSAVVDHNHDTGEVRGLLRSNINKFLGFFENENISLEQVENYLLGG